MDQFVSILFLMNLDYTLKEKIAAEEPPELEPDENLPSEPNDIICKKGNATMLSTPSLESTSRTKPSGSTQFKCFV